MKQSLSGMKCKTRNGFTLVEVSIVVIVIVILTSISVIGMTVYLKDARDSERATKTSLIVNALEKHYDRHGEYPSCASISSSDLTSAAQVLDGLDEQTFTAPRAPSESTNSITCTASPPSDDNDFFGYYAAPAVGNNDAALNYRLTYWNEDASETKILTSRRGN